MNSAETATLPAAPPTLPANGHADRVEEMNTLGRRVQMLMEELEQLPESPARDMAQECVRALLEFYGLGLERMMAVIKRSGIGGQKACDELVADRLVSGMLLIHGLHPENLDTRLRNALETIRPYMQSHGGNVELLSLDNEFARLRLQGACKTCPSSAVTMELAVRHAIEEACPDLVGFEVEGAAENNEITAPHRNDAPKWEDIEGAARVPEGGFMWAAVDQTPLVVCRLDGQLYAYRDRCPACNLPLHLGKLEAGMLACRAGHRYSVHNAGISPDDRYLYLEPVPLILNGDTVEVAIYSNASAQAR